MNERKIRILRALAIGPRTELSFTNGVLSDSIAPIHIKRYLGELVTDGYATVSMRDVFTITDAGREAAESREAITPSRIYGNASTSEPYRSPVWNIRPGSDAFTRIASRGVMT